MTDTYFGTVVNDPYRWLEQVDDPAVQQWMRAQADYARAVLDAIPGRDALLKRINQLDAATPARVIDVQRRPGGRLFFQQRGARDNQFKLYVRDAKGTRLLVDPEQVAKQTGTPHAINYMQPSWSGRYVAYGLSAAGSEDASLYVIDATSGRPVLGPITRAAYGAIGWLPDDSGLFFNRLQEMTAGMPAIEKFQKTRAVFVRLADGAQAAERAVAEYRARGEDAYFAHSRRGSDVLIGVFPPTAIDGTKQPPVFSAAITDVLSRHPEYLLNGQGMRFGPNNAVARSVPRRRSRRIERRRSSIRGWLDEATFQARQHAPS